MENDKKIKKFVFGNFLLAYTKDGYMLKDKRKSFHGTVYIKDGKMHLHKTKDDKTRKHYSREVIDIMDVMKRLENVMREVGKTAEKIDLQDPKLKGRFVVAQPDITLKFLTENFLEGSTIKLPEDGLANRYAKIMRIEDLKDLDESRRYYLLPDTKSVIKMKSIDKMRKYIGNSMEMIIKHGDGFYIIKRKHYKRIHKFMDLIQKQTGN